MAVGWHDGGGNQLAVVQLEDAIGDVEVLVVVADDQDGFAAGFQFRQQLGVEDIFEVRILIGSPFIEQVERPILQVSGEQSEPFALALRDRGGGKAPFRICTLWLEVKLLEVLRGLGVEARDSPARAVGRTDKSPRRPRKRAARYSSRFWSVIGSPSSRISPLREVQARDEFWRGWICRCRCRRPGTPVHQGEM